MNGKKNLRALVMAALFTALISVFTAFLFHIPVPIGANTAYIHFGDAFVFLAASILPSPFGIAAGAVGGFLADVFCGGLVWAPYTFLIKGLIAACFSSKKEKILCKRNYVSLFLALVITVIGYYIAEAIIYGNWVAPMLSVLGNVIQISGSSVIYILISLAFDKAKIKNKI